MVQLRIGRILRRSAGFNCWLFEFYMFLLTIVKDADYSYNYYVRLLVSVIFSVPNAR